MNKNVNEKETLVRIINLIIIIANPTIDLITINLMTDLDLEIDQEIGLKKIITLATVTINLITLLISIIMIDLEVEVDPMTNTEMIKEDSLVEKDLNLLLPTLMIFMLLILLMIILMNNSNLIFIMKLFNIL